MRPYLFEIKLKAPRVHAVLQKTCQLTLFQISTGAFPAGAANIIGNIAPDVVLAILFYWKSR